MNFVSGALESLRRKIYLNGISNFWFVLALASAFVFLFFPSPIIFAIFAVSAFLYFMDKIIESYHAAARGFKGEGFSEKAAVKVAESSVVVTLEKAKLLSVRSSNMRTPDGDTLLILEVTHEGGVKQTMDNFSTVQNFKSGKLTIPYLPVNAIIEDEVKREEIQSWLKSKEARSFSFVTTNLSGVLPYTAPSETTVGSLQKLN